MLEEIKNSSIMNIKGGIVCIKVEHRDWLIDEIDKLREELKNIKNGSGD